MNATTTELPDRPIYAIDAKLGRNDSDAFALGRATRALCGGTLRAPGGAPSAAKSARCFARSTLSRGLNPTETAWSHLEKFY